MNSPRSVRSGLGEQRAMSAPPYRPGHTLNTYKIDEFLEKWTPTPENKICKCAGDDICLPHQATRLVRRLASRV